MRTTAVVLTLVAPVSGPVAKAFDYGPDPFAAGQHRGVDLAARPGAVVRAACAGEVVAAGMRVVTLRCGPWRVTALPLGSVRARVGTRVRAGSVIGRVGTMAGHVGVHLGVRRADDAFGYVDPVPLLHSVGVGRPVAAAPRVGREGPRASEPPAGAGGPHAAPPHSGSADASPKRAAPPHSAPADAAPAHAVPAGSAPAVRSAPSTSDAAGTSGASAGSPPATAHTAALHAPPASGVRVSAGSGAGGLAPWPAWAGLAALLLGAVGRGVRIRLRQRLVPLAATAAERVPSAR